MIYEDIPTSWTDGDLDWDSPNPRDERYWLAIIAATHERIQAAVGNPMNLGAYNYDDNNMLGLSPLALGGLSSPRSVDSMSFDVRADGHWRQNATVGIVRALRLLWESFYVRPEQITKSKAITRMVNLANTDATDTRYERPHPISFASRVVLDDSCGIFGVPMPSHGDLFMSSYLKKLYNFINRLTITCNSGGLISGNGTLVSGDDGFYFLSFRNTPLNCKVYLFLRRFTTLTDDVRIIDVHFDSLRDVQVFNREHNGKSWKIDITTYRSNYFIDFGVPGGFNFQKPPQQST